MFSISPREYQKEALEEILRKREEGILNQLIVLPTGTGKTILFGMVAKHLNIKTLILAHRDQLIKQAVEKIKMIWPEVSIGVCMAEKNNINAQIVVGSIQSCCKKKRLDNLKDQDFQLLVIDEAHHSIAETYMKVIEELGFLKKDKNKLLIGVTATPERKNGGLGDVFEEIVFERSIGTMIRAGYLSNLKAKRILTSTNLDNVSISGGDFVQNELAEVCNTPERNYLIVDSFLEEIPDRKSIAFTCDIQHAKDLARCFQNKGVKAKEIYGAMKEEEKSDILKKFSLGEIQVLTNCSLLTEGFDEPSIDAILMSRPIRSKPLYIQCIGRGTRLYPGKSDCTILDFCDSFHDLNSIATLEKSIEIEKILFTEDSEAAKHQEDEEKNKNKTLVYLTRQQIGEFDLVGKTHFDWCKVKEGWEFRFSNFALVQIVRDGEAFMPILKEGNTLKKLMSKSVSVDYAMGVAEDWLKVNGKFYSKSREKWKKEIPTEKQMSFMKKIGIESVPENKDEASTLITQRINEKNLWKHEEATSKQKRFLAVNGISFERGLKKGEAYDLIYKFKNKKC